VVILYRVKEAEVEVPALMGKRFLVKENVVDLVILRELVVAAAAAEEVSQPEVGVSEILLFLDYLINKREVLALQDRQGGRAVSHLMEMVVLAEQLPHKMVLVAEI
jgi:hypothetical protein